MPNTIEGDLVRANDAMTRNVVWVHPHLKLSDAAELMRGWGIRHLPVFTENRLVGILSDRDILLRTHLSPDGMTTVDEGTVGDAMTAAPETCTPRSNLASIAIVMIERKIDSLPVMEDGKLVGLVTSTDLLGVLVTREREARVSDLSLRFQIMDWERGAFLGGR